MTRRSTLNVAALLAFGIATRAGLAQTPVGSALTYQGELRQSGAPGAGPVDLRFRLYTAETNGSQVGPEVALNNAALTGGRFTASLDFGASAFGADARWLEIDVRSPAGAGAFVTLTPRQPVTAAPYALGLRLPLVETVNSSSPALDIRNTGTGRAAYFQSSNPASNVTAVRVDTNSSNPGVTAIAGVNTGAGRAGFFQIANAANATEALQVTTNGSNGRAIYALADPASGPATAVFAQTNSTIGAGVVGRSTATTGPTVGVTGETNSPGGVGVFGAALATTGTPTGVAGLALGPGGRGVHGSAGSGYGVIGEASSGTGVYGHAMGTAGTDAGVAGVTSSPDGRGVHGWADSGTGVYGETSTGVGVLGRATATSGVTYGVMGVANSPNGYAGYFSGESYFGGEVFIQGGNDYSINARNTSALSTARFTNFGTGPAGEFQGDVNVTGTLTKAAGSFRIDHPLDPANKYLSHSFVESPDMKNMYDGIVVTDDRGYATVTMPAWFEALNREFRYQLTVIDGSDSDDFVLAKVVREIAGGAFTIRTSRAGVKVSWLVTGIRRDPWAEAHRILVEEEKPAHERGKYQHPEVYGMPRELGIHADAERTDPSEPADLNPERKP